MKNKKCNKIANVRKAKNSRNLIGDANVKLRSVDLHKVCSPQASYFSIKDNFEQAQKVCSILLLFSDFGRVSERLFVLTIGVVFHSLNSLFSSKGHSVGLTSATFLHFLFLAKVCANVDSNRFRASNDV